jgi:hypothetical protein
MAKLSVKKGSTSRVEYVFIGDNASASGAGLTGLAFNSSGLVSHYLRPAGTATTISLLTQTVTGSYSSGGFVEVDSLRMPGIYRFDIPNAVFASGVDKAVVSLTGSPRMIPVLMEYDLEATSYLDMTQAVPTSNTAETVGDALNAARAQGFGKWVISGTTLTLYANDGTTSVKSFTLNSATNPTSRTP